MRFEESPNDMLRDTIRNLFLSTIPLREVFFFSLALCVEKIMIHGAQVQRSSSSSACEY